MASATSHQFLVGQKSTLKTLVRLLTVSCLLTVAPSASPALSAELVMFEQEYCHWCDKWDEEIGVIYAKTPEGKRAPIRKVDIHAKLPKDLESIPSGNFTPTFVLVENGIEIDRLRGYPGEDFFWDLLDQMLKKLPAQSRSTAG